MTSTPQTPEVINFGKYKGTALNELKHSYVRWLLTLETLNESLRKSLKSLPWIQEELDREAAFQKRKAKAILFSQPCFQRERYSANQRISYNNSKFNG